MLDNKMPYLQPGQRLIVHTRANGDTEYICLRDRGLNLSSGSTSGGLILAALFSCLIYLLLPESAADKARKNDMGNNPSSALTADSRTVSIPEQVGSSRTAAKVYTGANVPLRYMPGAKAGAK